MSENKNKILIAEDDQELREMYAAAFLMEGFQVIEACDGKELMGYVKENHEKIKAILSDIVMPKMDGFEVLEEIKNDDKYKKIPVYMLTNLDSDKDRQVALGLGANEYFRKVDWTPSKLVQKIKTLCGC